ncbi:MAG: transcriptional regulator [Cytophagales bacterium]|nr:transcriptional regulator [Cytophagales bacterium]
MELKPIKTEKDYRTAMKRIDELILLDPKEDTPEYDELIVLSDLAWPYEEKHYPIEPPDPIEAIKYIMEEKGIKNKIEAIKCIMEEKGLKNKDVVKYFGSKSLVSEVLNRKRPLSLKMIKSLHVNLGIPYEILMG